MPSVVSVGSPSSSTETSVDVPPPSQVSTFAKPARWATIPAPSAPAAGPESTVLIGWFTTSVAESAPPFDRITANGRPSGRNWCSRSAMPATYRATVGLTATSTRVVIARSYSRYSRSTWLDSETTACGCSRPSTSSIACSCCGFAYECRKQTPIMFTSWSRNQRATSTARVWSNGRTWLPRGSSRPPTVSTRSAGTIRSGLTQK